MNDEKRIEDSPDARDAAIDWLMRQNDGPLTAKEQAEFDVWIASDPANKAAFDDIAGMFDRLTTMEFGRTPKARKSSAIIGRSLGLAASLVAMLAFFLFFDDLSLYMRSDHYAGTGETKIVALPDGSNVQLDAQSAITVRFEAGERRLKLLQGRAWFEVAPDSARPFIVEAAGGKITALGTAFDVATEDGRAIVSVTERRVRVESGGENVLVEQGQQSAYGRTSSLAPPAPVDIERVMSWRRGKLFFENRPLGEIVGVLSRYHRGAIFFLNPALRTRRVTGVFGVDDPVLALEAIQTALGRRIVIASRFLILLL